MEVIKHLLVTLCWTKVHPISHFIFWKWKCIFVVSVNPSSASLTEAVLSNATTGGSATPTLTYAENDIKCNYIKRPTDIDWGYTTINGTALYNSASATNFELHASEETTLVRKILALAGVIIEDPSIYQIASQEDLKNIQQEKQ